MTVIEQARQLTKSGFSVIPIKSDGSKAPAVLWKPYQQRIAKPEELKQWFRNGYGIGIVAGKVSGNLEVIDFDDPAAFEPWKRLVGELGGTELVKMLVIVETPRGGFHVYYRCADGVERNQKLAQRKGSDGKLKVLIETRGEGGYVVAPGSPKKCHLLKKSYKLLEGNLTEISTITSEERELLLSAARALNEHIESKRIISGNSDASGNRPGDDFNTRAQWAEILEPHGWQKVRETGEVTHWRRPDKNQGISATTNIGGSNLLYVFSTNGDPFEAQTVYSPFAAYTLLNHNRDFSAAAADLANKGYGEKPKQHHSTPYRTTPSGLEWLKPTSNGPVPVSLTNFTAEISADISRDDGLEVQHFFEIEAQAKGQTSRFTVPATQFQGMQWVTEHLGAQAVVYAGYGAKDHARAAIQLLSENISHRRVFTHTGWKRIDESWVYLHAGGAIGPDGTVNGVEVVRRQLLFPLVLPHQEIVPRPSMCLI